MSSNCFSIEKRGLLRILRLTSGDGTNRLTRSCVMALTAAVHALAHDPGGLIITGNDRFFSAGADLTEVSSLNGGEALQFARCGQELMGAVERFPAAVFAAVHGYCMGGGLDLALACQRRAASPNAIFGHRGASLGLITGWGGTQRLPRLIGRSQALHMLVAATKVQADEALRLGLVEAVTSDPVSYAMARLGADASAPHPIGCAGA